VNRLSPFGAALVIAASACGRSTASGATPPAAGSAASISASADASAPMDPLEADEWARAGAGDEDSLVRLVDRLGCEGLRERAQQPALEAMALRAMGRCPDFAELPWLADVAASGSEAEATDALAAIVDEAARPRRATDPDDAEELSEGCAKLLTLAKATDRPRMRRVNAIRALRMLADRGCPRRSDIPADLDARETADASK
jgi:hypothetical protein